MQPKQQDERIPVLLIQRSLEGSPDGVVPGSSSNAGSSPSLHGWMLIIPSGWSMPFFSSLTYTGTRVAGQRERQSQAFESGKPYFPRDYPCSTGYETYSDERAEDESERWERKPPAKRPNYDALLTRSPWKPDWDVVLSLQASSPVGPTAEQKADFVETQRHQRDVPSARPWLLRGPDVRAVLEGASSMFNHAAGLLDQINKLRAKRHLDLLNMNINPDDLWRAALVGVKLRMCGRGRPDDLAIIYRIDDEEHNQWTASIKKNITFSEDEEDQAEVRTTLFRYECGLTLAISVAESSNQA